MSFLDERDRPELSDLLVDYDRDGRRRPVSRRAVVGRLRAAGDGWGQRILARIPSHDDTLEEPVVDALLVAAHRELQRLNEEFQQGPRLLELVRALVAVAPPRPRIVDVGCGIGYIGRWLAAEGRLDAELIGCDMNVALIEEARRAAAAEKLDVRFEVQNAFALAIAGHIFTSTGVLHHFRGPDLEAFFAAHAASPDVVGFAHFDIEASWVSPLGSALFHLARMRVPLAQHDGIWSARRAHPGDRLVASARAALPGFEVGLFDRHRGLFPVTKVLRAVVGVRRDLADSFRAALGRRAARWAT